MAAARSTDRTTRQAALWATVVAVPVALIAGVLLFRTADRAVAPGEPSPTPGAARPLATAPVVMSARPLDDRTATVCRALLSQLPDQLRDLPARPVSAGPEQNAAYGDPAITLACGVAAPSVAPTDNLLVMDGLCWRYVEDAAESVWVAIDREVPVQVAVPASYRDAAQWVNGFSRTVLQSVPESTSGVPSGCP